MVAGDHPLFQAIVELGVAAKRYAADTEVLVVVRKATAKAGTAR
jgi:hypothetical protein